MILLLIILEFYFIQLGFPVRIELVKILEYLCMKTIVLWRIG